MGKHLMLFAAEGVAAPGSKYRAGARHAMLVYISTCELDTAAGEAVDAAERRGWGHVAIQRRKQLDPNPSTIEDDISRNAAEGAIREGSAIVVYADELPHNS